METRSSNEADQGAHTERHYRPEPSVSLPLHQYPRDAHSQEITYPSSSYPQHMGGSMQRLDMSHGQGLAPGGSQEAGVGQNPAHGLQGLSSLAQQQSLLALMQQEGLSGQEAMEVFQSRMSILKSSPIQRLVFRLYKQ